MIARLLAALAVLSGVAEGMPRKEAERIAQQFGWRRTRRSSGRIARKLNLAGRPAFNEYRGVDEIAAASHPHQDKGDWHLGGWDIERRQNRNAAKRRRRALRQPKRTPRRVPGDWSFSKTVLNDYHVGFDPGFGDPS